MVLSFSESFSYFQDIIWNFEISILVFFSLLYQTCPKQYYGDLEYRIINIHTTICYQSVIILEQGCSMLYDSRARNDCLQWLLAEGSINQWVFDDTLCCAMNCTLLCSLQPQHTLQQQLNTVLDVRLLGGRLFSDHVYPHLAKIIFLVLAK